MKDKNTFNIGDKTNYGIIAKFAIINNELKVYMEGYKNDNQYVNLKFIQHIKQPVFTTEDGVDMFEGDTYFLVRTNYILVSRIANSINVSSSSIKRFSTKKAAKNYIICNKPCLSLNEILDTFRTVYGKDSIHYHCFKTNLKSLIKPKL